jgi:hypothetical protein
VIFAALLGAALLLAAVAPGSAVMPSASKAKRQPAPVLRAPGLQSPRNDTTVDAVPAFTWGAVRRAYRYEFQLSADGAFRSSVFGRSGSQATANTAYALNTTLADGNYFWRVRAVTAKGDAGRWSATRTLHKSWNRSPVLQAPQQNATINSPDPAVLSWSTVPHAFKYSVQVATDPSLGSPAPGFSKPVETSGTDLAVPFAFAPGRYYWAVAPLDADRHSGARSSTGSFVVAWPSATATHVQDLNPDDRVYDPQFSWDPIPGAARYEVEINTSAEFAPGSKVCCTDPTTGTSLSPTHVLPNNTGDGGGYFWRVRAIDSDGNAGQWNFGPGFPKYFNPTTISSIPNLHIGDHSADPVAGATPDVAYPVASWDPAPGASSYEVEVAPTVAFAVPFDGAVGTTITVDSTASMFPGTSVDFANGDVRTIKSITNATDFEIDSPLSSMPSSGSLVTVHLNNCNWAATVWDVDTAATAWTPMAPGLSATNPMGRLGSISLDRNKLLSAGERYCVRVRARADRDAKANEVVSPWTELGNLSGGQPSFRYEPPPPPTTCTGSTPVGDSDYLGPRDGVVSSRLPLFRWKPIANACSYYVVVARDDQLTDIVDIALTRDPDYAPRLPTNPKTYSDEQSSYYWFVIPAGPAGNPATYTAPGISVTQQFQKRSTPPTPLAPVGGVVMTTQPTFRWTAAEGAREYRLQVAQDPSFGNPIDDVVTDATAFTSSSTYPSDTLLYWRVRADDENKTGLPWSPVQTFERSLPAPNPSADNPTGGRTIPLLRWAPVEGAVSYDVHVDQPDGTHKDFTFRSDAFTPTTHYGTGVWTWKVRANFPKIPSGVTPGAYSDNQPFTRFIGSPAGARGVASSSRMLLSWDPVEMAKSYRVEVSTTSSFATTFESQQTDNTSFAPKLTSSAYKNGGRLYWRVASLDEGNFLGGWTTGTFSLPKQIKVLVKGSLRRGMRKRVTVSVTDMRGRAIRKAKVQVSGGGLGKQAKRTSRKGTTAFQLRPGHRGAVKFLASKGGYRSGSIVLKVG